MRVTRLLRLAIFVSVASVCAPSFAVDFDRTLIGVHGGMNVARLENAAGVTSRNGVLAGGNLELPVGGFWFLQLEGYYVQKGASYDAATAAALSATSAVTQFDLLETALFVKAKFGVPVMTVELLAGPSFGFALTRQLVVTATSGGATTNTDLTSTMSSTDFGLQFGAGVEFEATAENTVFMNLRYTMGLSSITTDGVKTKGFLFLGGLRFKI